MSQGVGKTRKVSPGVTLSQKASPWSLTPQKASPRDKSNQKASPRGNPIKKHHVGALGARPGCKKHHRCAPGLQKAPPVRALAVKNAQNRAGRCRKTAGDVYIVAIDTVSSLTRSLAVDDKHARKLLAEQRGYLLSVLVYQHELDLLNCTTY